MSEAGRDAFFHVEGSTLVPATHARSPWSVDMLHGRLLAGLAAREIEQHHADDGLHVARLTVDLFRSPPMAPLEVASHVVRDGRRIRVVDVDVAVAGEAVARTTGVLLRHAEQPAGEVWSPPDWDAPHPDTIEQPPSRGMGIWDMRPVTPGGFGALRQKRTWLRENRPLVAGEALTPLVRAAVAADFANPFANAGSQGLQFINADITLYLRRVPVSDWLGFEVTQHASADGVAIGACTMYDTDGVLGTSTVCAVANSRR